MTSDLKEFKSSVNFVRRWEELLVARKFGIEGNDTEKKFRVAGPGPPKRAVNARKALLEHFVDIRTSLKGLLPTGIFCELFFSYDLYMEDLKAAGKEPPQKQFVFSKKWLKSWCKEFNVSMKSPNKRFKISASARKSRIIDYLKNVSTVRHEFLT